MLTNYTDVYMRRARLLSSNTCCIIELENTADFESACLPVRSPCSHQTSYTAGSRHRMGCIGPHYVLPIICRWKLSCDYVNRILPSRFMLRRPAKGRQVCFIIPRSRLALKPAYSACSPARPCVRVHEYHCKFHASRSAAARCYGPNTNSVRTRAVPGLDLPPRRCF